MREILFRGKSERSGEWVYGSLIVTHGGCVIYSKYHPLVTAPPEKKGDYLNQYVVDPRTVGQFTGLTDKNGKKVFEGDIVSGFFNHEKIVGYIFYGSDASFFIQRDGLFGIGLNNASDWLEVLGNIHDNPELLKYDGEKQPWCCPSYGDYYIQDKEAGRDINTQGLTEP